jgi:hypothetical protein
MDFWEAPGRRPLGDDEWAGCEDVAAEVMAKEHLAKHGAAHAVTFTRTFPTYTETMLIQGFPAAKLITVTHPPVPSAGLAGCVRDLPVGWRDMASAETFRARFDQVVGSFATQGWRRAEVRG